jgi:capsular exopolysaccharide synthesis family protein
MSEVSIYNFREPDISPSDDSLHFLSKLDSKHIEVPHLKDIEHVKCTLTPKSRFVTPGNGNSPVVEQLRLFDHRLTQFRLLQPFKRVLITSAVPGEGKTFVTVNLAITMASSSCRVLLIDGDLRRGDIGRRLGLAPKPGLTEVLEGKFKLSESLQFVEPLNFFLLGAGTPGAKGDPLNTTAAKELFQRLGDYFDFIAVDSPPVLPFSDTHRLALLTDGIVIVARENVTRRSELEEAIAALSSHRVLGVVLNSSSQQAERQYHYYKHYKNR